MNGAAGRGVRPRRCPRWGTRSFAEPQGLFLVCSQVIRSSPRSRRACSPGTRPGRLSPGPKALEHFNQRIHLGHGQGGPSRASSIEARFNVGCEQFNHWIDRSVVQVEREVQFCEVVHTDAPIRCSTFRCSAGGMADSRIGASSSPKWPHPPWLLGVHELHQDGHDEMSGVTVDSPIVKMVIGSLQFGHWGTSPPWTSPTTVTTPTSFARCLPCRGQFALRPGPYICVATMGHRRSHVNCVWRRRDGTLQAGANLILTASWQTPRTVVSSADKASGLEAATGIDQVAEKLGGTSALMDMDRESLRGSPGQSKACRERGGPVCARSEVDRSDPAGVDVPRYRQQRAHGDGFEPPASRRAPRDVERAPRHLLPPAARRLLAPAEPRKLFPAQASNPVAQPVWLGQDQRCEGPWVEVAVWSTRRRTIRAMTNREFASLIRSQAEMIDRSLHRGDRPFAETQTLPLKL